MAEKHIFIGLGGSGVKTVSLIKYKIYERTKGTGLKSRLQVMNDTYRFIFVDTDSRDVSEANNEYRRLFEDGKVTFIADNELLNLGDMNPVVIYNESVKAPTTRMNRRIVESCTEKVKNKMEDRNLSFGAGAVRLKSRIAFGRKEQDFLRMLQNDINDLNRNEIDNEKNVIHYWVVSSSNGGTGSGTLQDVLYLVNMTHRTHIDSGNPKLGLILYMPRIYMIMNPSNQKYPRNAYALLNELQSFQKWSTDEQKNKLFHRMALVNDYTLFDETMSYRPFEFCVPIDFHTEEGTNLGDIKKMYSTTAELLFYIHSGVGASGFKSFLDNYTDGNTEGDKNSSTIKAADFLIPMGFTALRKPEDQFENYLTSRAKYEMLRYGIIGSPIDEEKSRKDAMLALFNSTISRYLLPSDGKSKSSYFSQLLAIVDNALEQELPEEAIKSEKNNAILQQLPGDISTELGRGCITSIHTAVGRLGAEKAKTRKDIEKALWSWTEDNARKWGLQFVKDVLMELDAYCTELYTAYVTGVDSDKLQDLGFKSRKTLSEAASQIEGTLDSLYEQAATRTLGERLSRTNAVQILSYYSALRNWVEASAKVLIGEETFEIIQQLSVGDSGAIDTILTHVRRMIAAATAFLNGDSGAQQGYSSLAKSFYTTKMDVTSVFLPDITEYADGYGWVEDGNLFSEWYGQIIAHGNDFVLKEGYAPLRNGGQHSLEALFSEIVTRYGNDLVQKKYLVDGESHLFTCTSKSNQARVIEDILDYSIACVKALVHENETISKMWYEKSLADFYKELDSERSLAIQNRVKPVLFFPNNRAQDKGAKKVFGVGPKGVTDNLFQGLGDSILYSDDKSTIYQIKTLLGLSFSSYDQYNALRNEYEKVADKEIYHFHQAFARAGSNPDRIQLPKEIGPEVVVFTKYLLLNEICRSLRQWVRRGESAYNKNAFAPSPLLRTQTTMRFAKMGALRKVEDFIEIRTAEGGINYFQQVVAQRPLYRWTDFMSGFADHFHDGNFASVAKDLINGLSYLCGDKFQSQYYSAVVTLTKELNDKYGQASERIEQETLRDILLVLETRLNTFEKFID